jgi:hypothetical protein
MSKVSNKQRLDCLKVWIESLKYNSKRKIAVRAWKESNEVKK